MFTKSISISSVSRISRKIFKGENCLKDEIRIQMCKCGLISNFFEKVRSICEFRF